MCDLGKERIRRAGKQIKMDWEKKHPSGELFGSDEEFTTDIGFKVFKLDSTNVNEWDPNMKLDEKELAMRLGEVFKEDRSKEDILYEIMLKYGVFDKQVEEINVNGKTMYRVGKRYMIVCLEDSITSEDEKLLVNYLLEQLYLMKRDSIMIMIKLMLCIILKKLALKTLSVFRRIGYETKVC